MGAGGSATALRSWSAHPPPSLGVALLVTWASRATEPGESLLKRVKPRPEWSPRGWVGWGVAASWTPTWAASTPPDPPEKSRYPPMTLNSCCGGQGFDLLQPLRIFLGDIYLVFRILFVATVTPVSAMLVGNAKGVQVRRSLPSFPYPLSSSPPSAFL